MIGWLFVLVAVTGLTVGYILAWNRTTIILQVAIAATVIVQLLEGARSALSQTARLTFVPAAVGLVMIAALWVGGKLRARTLSGPA